MSVHKISLDSSIKSRVNYLLRESENDTTFPQNAGADVVDIVFNKLRERDDVPVQLSISESNSSFTIKDTYDTDMDPRLRAWSKILKERELIQRRIQLKTGKRHENVLFNRPATIDNQSKQMMLRVIDTAKRSEVAPSEYKHGVLQRRQHLDTCGEVPELHATEPQLQQLEFVGLPLISKLELANTKQMAKDPWQKSEVLLESLGYHKDAIKEVLEFCPAIEELQVAPGFQPTSVVVHESRFIAEEPLLKVSSETSESDAVKVIPVVSPPDSLPVIETPSENRVRINGIAYAFGNMQGILSTDLEVYFKSEPYVRVCKCLVLLENIGNNIIYINWKPLDLHKKELMHNVSLQQEFLFDCRPFSLFPGQRRRLDVMYFPTAVGVRKLGYIMYLERSPFCGVRHLNIRLYGLCTPSAIFEKYLERARQQCIDNRNRQSTERLAKFHAELAPIIEPSHLECPYERLMDEREVFGALNPGLQCLRYGDLETLKQLYALVKKPRQPSWNLSIGAIRDCIYQHEPSQRNTLQQLLMDIIEPMRCDSVEVAGIAEHDEERERSCFIYVRGIICGMIEDWEQMAETLEHQFSKSELQNFARSLADMRHTIPKDDDTIDWYLTKKVRGNKYCKDSLYIQTYTLLCDAAENIASAIESTVHHL